MTFEQEFICKRIMEADNPKDIFGTNISNMDDFKKIYRSMIVMVHPDKCQPQTKEQIELASRAFTNIQKLKATAEKYILNGEYDRLCQMGNAPYGTIEVGKTIYHIMQKLAEGDFSSVFLAEKEINGTKTNVCLKVSSTLITDSDLSIKNEREILEIIKKKPYCSLPVLLGHFKTRDGDLVNEMEYIPGHDFISTRELYPQGVTVQAGMWIMARLLLALGHLHSNCIMHNSLMPSNIMITNFNHNAIPIDYTCAISEANKKGKKYTIEIPEYTAPEITSNKKITIHPRTDLYSLGKCMMYILGGDLGGKIPLNENDEFRQFIDKFVQNDPNKRAQDAYLEWEILDDMRTRHYGPERFKHHLDKLN